MKHSEKALGGVPFALGWVCVSGGAWPARGISFQERVALLKADPRNPYHGEERLGTLHPYNGQIWPRPKKKISLAPW